MGAINLTNQTTKYLYVLRASHRGGNCNYPSNETIILQVLSSTVLNFSKTLFFVVYYQNTSIFTQTQLCCMLTSKTPSPITPPPPPPPPASPPKNKHKI